MSGRGCGPCRFIVSRGKWQPSLAGAVGPVRSRTRLPRQGIAPGHWRVQMASPAESRQFSFGGLSEALDLVVTWFEALHGRGEVAESLHLMLRLVKGRRASLVRLHLDTAAQTVLDGVDPGGAEPSPRELGISFPQYLLGHGLGQAQAGSVWYVSDLAREIAADERAGVHLCSPDHRTREIAAIVLEPRRLTSDLLEVHFATRLSPRDAEALALLAGVLSRGWRHRNESIFPPAPDRDSAGGVASEPSRAGAILSAANPAGLSRSEYRVCELASRGLGAKAISDRLSVAESTVRSHLRSIYAKTGASGQRELIWRLHGQHGPRGADWGSHLPAPIRPDVRAAPATGGEAPDAL
jgi:DNA-binding CsgD family transcriptional regulator